MEKLRKKFNQILRLTLLVMETKNFEKKLQNMTQPQFQDLKLDSMLADAIINAKDKSVVRWWCLSIPAFEILMLMIKVDSCRVQL